MSDHDCTGDEGCTRTWCYKDQLTELKAKVAKFPELATESFGDMTLSDLQVQAGRKIFYVTKMQLSQKSEVLNNICCTQLRDPKDNLLKIKGTPEAVDALLKYIYTHKKVEDVEIARKLVELADRLRIEDLKNHCELFLVENTDPFTADDNYELARKFKLPVLRAKSLEFLYFHLNDVLQGPANSYVAGSSIKLCIADLKFRSFPVKLIMRSTFHSKSIIFLTNTSWRPIICKVRSDVEFVDKLNYFTINAGYCHRLVFKDFAKVPPRWGMEIYFTIFYGGRNYEDNFLNDEKVCPRLEIKVLPKD